MSKSLFADIVEIAAAQNDAYLGAYQAGHDEGYKLGYKEATAKARELIAEVSKSITTPACPTCGGKGKSVVSKETGEIVTYCGCE